MLNSAAGVVLPRPTLPPMSETCAIRSLRSWCSRNSVAMFVRGPVGIRVTGSGVSLRVSAISGVAPRSWGSKEALGISGPSSPLSPWMFSAVLRGRWRGEEAPAATGTPVCPIRDRMRRAFRVVLSSGTFPATVVTARRSSSGVPQASMIATASSCPGSTSRITGFIRVSYIVPGQMYSASLYDRPQDLLDGGHAAGVLHQAVVSEACHAFLLRGTTDLGGRGLRRIIECSHDTVANTFSAM